MNLLNIAIHTTIIVAFITLFGTLASTLGLAWFRDWLSRRRKQEGDSEAET